MHPYSLNSGYASKKVSRPGSLLTNGNFDICLSHFSRVNLKGKLQYLIADEQCMFTLHQKYRKNHIYLKIF
jgi:hypothetical protein